MKKGLGYIEEFYQLCTITKINSLGSLQTVKLSKKILGFHFPLPKPRLEISQKVIFIFFRNEGSLAIRDSGIIMQ